MYSRRSVMLLLLEVMAPQQDNDRWREFVVYVLHDG